MAEAVSTSSESVELSSVDEEDVMKKLLAQRDEMEKVAHVVETDAFGWKVMGGSMDEGSLGGRFRQLQITSSVSGGQEVLWVVFLALVRQLDLGSLWCGSGAGVGAVWGAEDGLLLPGMV